MPDGSLNTDQELDFDLGRDLTGNFKLRDCSSEDSLGKILSVTDFIQLCRDPQVSVDDLRAALPLSVRTMLSRLEQLETPFKQGTPGLLEGEDAVVRENLIFVCQWADSFHNEVKGALFTELHECLPKL